MNYERIYNEFIENRRLIEPAIFSGAKLNLRSRLRKQIKKDGAFLFGNYETHHILPKSLGGDDEICNLITLTISDHIFAHMLLAKIYGGSQWFSIERILCNYPGKYVTDKRVRRFCEKAKIKANLTKSKMMSEMKKDHEYIAKIQEGVSKAREDKKIYHFWHSLHGDVHCTRNELEALYGVNKLTSWAICTGRTLMTRSGWCVVEFNPERKPLDTRAVQLRESNPMKREEIYEKVMATRKTLDSNDPGRYKRYSLNRIYAKGEKHHMHGKAPLLGKKRITDVHGKTRYV
jgi:hypothetical protein